MAGALFLLLEVQRPLQQLERALARVGLEAKPEPMPQRGAPEVRRLAQRFNAMLQRLEDSERERATMLAGIAHDLKTPLTRLRLRLSMLGDGAASARAGADLDDLERITGQFLLFAGGGGGEAAVQVPLAELLAELAARYDGQPVELDLAPVTATVQPITLGRAVANLIDNALSYGQPPVRLVLRAWQKDGFELQVWDQGQGIAEEQRTQALMPFQRLDEARSGHGHCGLGLAIAQRVARTHGGELRLGDQPLVDLSPEPVPGQFCVSLSGHSLSEDRVRASTI